MSNKNKKLGLGIAAVAAAGAGLVYAAQKTSQQKVKKIAKAFAFPPRRIIFNTTVTISIS